MVLLTWVPVSLPGSMDTGVMVATGAPPLATGGASAVGAGMAVPPVVDGAAASEAEMSLLLSSNILSRSEQAVRPRPAVNTHASRRPDLRPRLAGIPLILLSAAGAPAPKREAARINPNPLGQRPPAKTREFSLNEAQEDGQGHESLLSPFYTIILRTWRESGL